MRNLYYLNWERSALLIEFDQYKLSINILWIGTSKTRCIIKTMTVYSLPFRQSWMHSGYETVHLAHMQWFVQVLIRCLLRDITLYIWVDVSVYYLESCKIHFYTVWCDCTVYTVVEMKSFRCGESAWTAGFGPNAGQHTRAGMGAGEAAERPAMCQKISKHCFEIVKIYAL